MLSRGCHLGVTPGAKVIRRHGPPGKGWAQPATDSQGQRGHGSGRTTATEMDLYNWVILNPGIHGI